MDEPLLLTKFYMPALPTEFSIRPRLLEQPNALRKLTLICAPAGFGKTILASCRLTNQDRPVAWFSLDESDNDPQRFFTYLITSLNQIDSNIGKTALDTMQSAYPPPIAVLLSHLINDLSQSKQRFILVLDDYHLIVSEPIHKALTFLLDNMPPQLHLVIISRTEPPLPIAKIRAKNQLTELYADDLRFTKGEIETFLNQTMGLGLTIDQIEKLESRTEGWITGLQLAALSLKKTSDMAGFIHRLSGTDRYIAEYLTSEVISHQPGHIHRFLLHTSILGRMNADLCNTLLRISDSQNILETLEESNLFVSPLDNNRQWYRYHHLFAEMLRNLLRREEPEYVAQLHVTAAGWFMAHNMLHESIDHYLEAKDYERVVTHLIEIGDQILSHGNFRTYLNWIDRLPKSYINLPIALYQLFFLHEMGEFNAFDKRLDFVEALIGPFPDEPYGLDPESVTYFGILAVIKGIRKASEFATNEASTHFEQALRLLPEEKVFWRILSFCSVGFCNRINGNYLLAIDHFSKAAKLAINNNQVFLSFMNSIALAKVYLENGQLENALLTCRTLLAFNEKQTPKVSYAGLAYVMLGKLLYHTAELSSSEKYIKLGLDQVVKAGDAFSIMSGYFTLSLIYVAQNKPKDAIASIMQMKEIINQLKPSKAIHKMVKAYEINILIISNQLEEADEWFSEPGYNHLKRKKIPDLISLPYLGIYRAGQEPLTYYANRILIITARYAIFADKLPEAVRILDELISKAKQEASALFKSQALILKALALQKLGKVDLAVSSLIAAIEMIAPEPFFQIFLREGPSMKHLLEQTQKRLSAPENQSGSGTSNVQISQFIALVLAKMTSASPKTKGSKSSHSDLTTREIEVLSCLAQGLTYSDTAEQLFISINTLKTHIKNIYRKLNVANRTQAVNKAKVLRLLDRSPRK